MTIADVLDVYLVKKLTRATHVLIKRCLQLLMAVTDLKTYAMPYNQNKGEKTCRSGSKSKLSEHET